MIKDYFINRIETAIINAVKNNDIGEMKDYECGTLIVERPKNPDFGDFAVNVSSLARLARISPAQIAQNILKYIEQEDKQ